MIQYTYDGSVRISLLLVNFTFAKLKIIRMNQSVSFRGSIRVLDIMWRVKCLDVRQVRKYLNESMKELFITYDGSVKTSHLPGFATLDQMQTLIHEKLDVRNIRSDKIGNNILQSDKTKNYATAEQLCRIYNNQDQVGTCTHFCSNLSSLVSSQQYSNNILLNSLDEVCYL